MRTQTQQGATAVSDVLAAAAERRRREQQQGPSAASAVARRRLERADARTDARADDTRLNNRSILIFGCGPAAWTLAFICRINGFVVHMWCPNKEVTRRYIMLCQPSLIREMAGENEVIERLTTLSKAHIKHAATHLPPFIEGFHKNSTTEDKFAPFSITWTTLRDFLKAQTTGVVELRDEPDIGAYSYVVSADGSSRQVARRMKKHSAVPLTSDNVYGMTIVYTSTNGNQHVKDPRADAQRGYRLFADGDNRYIGLRVANVRSDISYYESIEYNTQVNEVHKRVVSKPFTRDNIALSKFYNFADTLTRVPGNEAFDVTLDEADEGRVIYSQVYQNEYNSDMKNTAAALMIKLRAAMDSLNEPDREELMQLIEENNVQISPIFRLQLTTESVGPVVEAGKMYQIGDALLQWDFFGGMGVNAAIASAIVLGETIGSNDCDERMNEHYRQLYEKWNRNNTGLGRSIISDHIPASTVS